MFPGHQHFRLDDGDEPDLLTQGGVPGQGVRVGIDTGAGRNAGTDSDDRAPFGKARAHLEILLQTDAQSVKTFSYFLSGVAGQILGTGVHFYAGNDAGIDDDPYKGNAIALSFADRLVVEDETANALAETRCRDDQLAVGAACLLRLGYAQGRRPLPLATSVRAVSLRAFIALAIAEHIRVRMALGQRWRSARFAEVGGPMPVPDIRHIFQMLANVAVVFVELAVEQVDGVRSLGPQPRDVSECVDRKMETTHLVEHDHVEGCGSRAAIHVAAHVETALVGPPMDHRMNEPAIVVKREDDGGVLSKERIE